MTIQTRRNCSWCRLAKCLAVGMSPELIRKEEQKPVKDASNQLKKSPRQQSKEPNRQKTSFVVEQRVQLTPMDWAFLSQIIRNFDQLCLTSTLRRTIDDLASSTSTVVHFDLGNALEMLGSIFSSMFAFVQSSPHFRLFDANLQWLLIERYFSLIVEFSSLQIYRDFHLFKNEKFAESFVNIFGSTMFDYLQRISDKLDADSNLLKISYLILFFSAEFPLGNRSPTISSGTATLDRRSLFLIQNQYVELLWKYSLHRYGFLHSTRKFLRLLDLIHQLTKYSTWNYTNNTLYHDLVDQSLETIKQSLVVKPQGFGQLWAEHKQEPEIPMCQ